MCFRGAPWFAVTPACQHHGVLHTPERLLCELRRFVDDLDPADATADQAAELVSVFAAIEKVAGAGIITMAPRAAEGTSWLRAGHRSPGSWLAELKGAGLGAGIDALETGDRLATLPATATALRNGELSGAQAKEIAAAAIADPRAEAELLDAAKVETLRGLKEKAKRIKLRRLSEASLVEREDHNRRSRYLRHRVDELGAVLVEGKFAADDGARIVAALEARAKGIFEQAAADGRKEPSAAYLADALLAVCSDPPSDTKRRGPSTLVHLRVDMASLRRGSVEGDELCEIAGVGRVSMATARTLMADSFLSILVMKGVDVQAVAHAGRTIPAHIDTALRARDPRCVVPGCSVAHGLEIDHWSVAFADGGPSELWNLARICVFHHRLKTHRGWVLTGGPGAWAFHPPPGGEAASDETDTSWDEARWDGIGFDPPSLFDG